MKWVLMLVAAGFLVALGVQLSKKITL